MRKINIGCGTNVLEGWENYELQPNPLSGIGELDITKPLPFQDASVDFILIEHVLEHVTGPQAFRFMQEAHRVLCKDGILRICVPWLAYLTKEERVGIITLHGHLMVYSNNSLYLMLDTAGFAVVRTTCRRECDGHWRVIGKALDHRETLRVEAIR